MSSPQSAGVIFTTCGVCGGVSVGVDGLVSIGMVMAMNSNVCATTTITVNTALKKCWVEPVMIMSPS